MQNYSPPFVPHLRNLVNLFSGINIKIVATRPRWESLQRSPRPLAVFNGPTSKGRERKGKDGKGEGKRRWRERGGRGTPGPPMRNPGYATGRKSVKSRQVNSSWTVKDTAKLI